MSRRTGLREFQESLARRLAGAATHDALRSRLVLESGDLLWLLSLPDAGEMMTVPMVTRVPLTRRWYNGLVNVRGSLYGVIDLADFCGRGVTPRTSESAFLLCGHRHGVNAGILVRRVAGLRNAQDFQPVQGGRPDKPWVSALLADHEGREFREINMAALVRSPDFMDIAAEKAA
jgi:twitching motility protein PilI